MLHIQHMAVIHFINIIYYLFQKEMGINNVNENKGDVAIPCTHYSQILELEIKETPYPA